MNESRDRSEQLRYRLNLALIWVIQYWKELFNFRFDRYMIIQVLPGAYGLTLAGIALFIGYMIVQAFTESLLFGLFALFIAGPLGFLVAASVLRALLEFYMVIFRIAEQVDELVGMRDTVDRLSGIGESVHEMASLTRRLPFWRTIRKRRDRRERVPENARRRAEPGAYTDHSDTRATSPSTENGNGNRER